MDPVDTSSIDCGRSGLILRSVKKSEDHSRRNERDIHQRSKKQVRLEMLGLMERADTKIIRRENDGGESFD